jgi:hypothetical protein
MTREGGGDGLFDAVHPEAAGNQKQRAEQQTEGARFGCGISEGGSGDKSALQAGGRIGVEAGDLACVIHSGDPGDAEAAGR